MNLRKTVGEVDQKYHDRRVVLVDTDDREIGVGGLVEAHRDRGLKHRAFSLQLYRVGGRRKELLLQKRATAKPAFPGYWANTCCYNMAPGEQYIERAVGRVYEEMGIRVEAQQLRELYKFSYEVTDIEGWCENELDNVIVGMFDSDFEINLEEVEEVKWVEWSVLKEDIEKNRDSYAPWFVMIMNDPRFRKVFE